MSISMVQKRRSVSFLGLRCACRDSRSVSVSVSASASQSSSSDLKSTTPTPTPTTRRVREMHSSADTMTITSPSTCSYWEEEAKSTPSFSGLLRQLNELEQAVMSWGRCTPPPSHDKEEEKERWRNKRSSGGGGERRLEESIAMVKETEDPLGDFRRSMLQMIVENEIVDGDELRELLRRFLALNSPRHHDTILRAFAEIWEEVFAGYENTPNLLLRCNYPRLPSPPRRF